MDRFNRINKTLLIKKLVFIFLFFTQLGVAQSDSLKHPKVRIDIALPFEACLTYYKGSNTSEYPEWAQHLLNNNKKFGISLDLINTQIIFFNKFQIETGYSMRNVGFLQKEAIKSFANSNPNYFIQEQSEYATSGPANTYGSHGMSYFKIGIGINLKIFKSNYIQPYCTYLTGKGSMPEGTYSFKEYNSNYFYVNTYSFSKNKTTGFLAGLRFKHYMNGDKEPSNAYAFWGIKIEIASINRTAEGEITTTEGVLKNENRVNFNVNKKFINYSIAIYSGIGYKGNKYKHVKLFEE